MATDIYAKILAFSSYGFPESHAISFAYLVYASAWLKRYYPAAFTAALLRNQPMGFYSPHSLISDARRHGVTVRGVDVNASDALATLEARTASAPGTGPGPGRHQARPGRGPQPGPFRGRRGGRRRAQALPGPGGLRRQDRAVRRRRWRRWPPRARSAASG